jgi:hypothetical protein
MKKGAAVDTHRRDKNAWYNGKTVPSLSINACWLMGMLSLQLCLQFSTSVVSLSVFIKNFGFSCSENAFFLYQVKSLVA